MLNAASHRLAGAVLPLFISATAFLAGPAQGASVTINVDASLNRRAIDPRIYGFNYASTSQLTASRGTLNRWGGNNTSRYNWRLNADNRGADWYFESLAYSSATEGAEVDDYIDATRAGGAEPMITIPIIGWLANLGPDRERLASFSIEKYGAQTGNDWEWFADAGNGILAATGEPVSGNDEEDASVFHDALFQRDWVNHLVERWGAADAGGVRYYILDNEHSMWWSTHRDVRPVGPRMEEIRDLMIDYGARVKEADPDALVLGPEEWGWTNYLYSGYDSWYADQHGWSYFPDRSEHGDWDYLPWLLDQFRRQQESTGTRILDVFTVHYYPQGGELSSDTSNAMQLRRNRSTRSLWDPTYVDETWIADTIRLIPRLREWVDAYYPGTQIGVTEYTFGADSHINGATAQADVLGIFGREGLDLATRWVVPDSATPTFKVFQMYRNYDGAGGAFGDVSVSAGGPNPDQVAVFAAERSSDQALTVMVVNKVPGSAYDATINLGGFDAAGSAQVWRLTSANRIDHLADVAVSGGRMTSTLPAQSITLYVLPSNATPSVSLSVDDIEVTEGDSGTVSAAFTVTLSAASSTAVTAAYATSNGTATSGSDYVAASGTLSFAVGQTSKRVSVSVRGDALDENDETFTLALSVPAGATLADGVGQATIRDDDPLPTLSIDDARITEGNTGSSTISLPVRLSTASGRVVTVEYATADGSALAGSDYTATSGVLTIAAGATSATLAVPVLGDTVDEDDETLTVTLSWPSGAEIADGQAVATIADNDGTVTLSVSDGRVTEATGSAVSAAFTVTLSAASSQRVTVSYATANGSAVAPGDYAQVAGVLTFPAGATTRTVAVSVKGDALDEPDETFELRLASPVNATLADATGQATIVDNDGPPRMTVADSRRTEGNPGGTAAALAFKVSLGVASGQEVTVGYATAGGTATAGSDYTEASGVLTFAPGTLAQTVSVPILADGLDEANETVTLTLASATNATVADGQGVGTIVDDDPAPTLRVADASAVEGAAGATTTMRLTVTLSAVNAKSVSVAYATANGTAVSGQDYTTAAGSLTFDPGVTERAVDVSVLGDALDEADETVRVTLSRPVNATIAAGVAVGTISDDDDPPTLAVGDASVTEATGTAVSLVFPVTLSAASGRRVTGSYSTANGSATAPGDFAGATGTLTFPAGTTSRTVAVRVKGDALAEGDETLELRLSAPVNAVLGDGVGVGTVVDND
jgi:hypothetical protein